MDDYKAHTATAAPLVGKDKVVAIVGTELGVRGSAPGTSLTVYTLPENDPHGDANTLGSSPSGLAYGTGVAVVRTTVGLALKP